MIEMIGAIGSTALQVLGGITLCRWVWRESEEGGRIHRIVSGIAFKFLTWWDEK